MESKTLEKLEAMLNKPEDHRFDEEEIEVLNRVIHMVRGFDALGSLAGFVKNTVVWFGIVVGGFIAFKTDVIDQIMSVISPFLKG